MKTLPDRNVEALRTRGPGSAISANPTRQPCRSCRYFHPSRNAGSEGWCESIESDTQDWWTGCVRHSPNTEIQRSSTVTGDEA